MVKSDGGVSSVAISAGGGGGDDWVHKYKKWKDAR